MKLLVVGATGPTGLLLVKEAVERGHTVTALVRSPDKLTTKHANLKVIKGDVMSREDLSKAMSGCDAVLSAIGGRNGTFRPCTVYSTSIRAIVAAMKETGVLRIVLLSAWGTQYDPRLPFYWRWLLQPTMLRHIFHDLRIMEDILTSKECDVIKYTVVRAPALYNIPPEGGEIQETEGQLVVGPLSHISRHDLAIYMLGCLDTPFYERKMIAVCGPKK